MNWAREREGEREREREREREEGGREPQLGGASAVIGQHGVRAHCGNAPDERGTTKVYNI